MSFLKRKFYQAFTLLKYPKTELSDHSLCMILKSYEEINECTTFLRQRGFASHIIPFKDWDLAHIIPEIKDGRFLDMGSSDSCILPNLVIKGFPGELHGIDLREPIAPVRGVKYAIGDLIDTKYPDNYFTNITCLSVIEHGVDIHKFAAEASRLLVNGGKIFITFDYWEPKVTTHVRLYNLDWQPLDKEMLDNMIGEFRKFDLHPVEKMDYTTGTAVITKENYSPDPAVSYTFGMITFEKKISG